MNSTWNSRARVLCFSRDRVLGETRRLILGRRYDAVFAGSLEELASLATTDSFEVIVLCHTLSEDDHAGCLELARAVWPSARIVSVVSGVRKTPPEAGTVVLGLDGPEALMNSVRRLLEPTRPGLGPI